MMPRVALPAILALSALITLSACIPPPGHGGAPKLVAPVIPVAPALPR